MALGSSRLSVSSSLELKMGNSIVLDIAPGPERRFPILGHAFHTIRNDENGDAKSERSITDYADWYDMYRFNFRTESQALEII